MSSGRPSDFDEIPLGGTVRLGDPQSALGFELEGADSHSLTVKTPPGFADEEAAGEMAELYWRALTRDVPFSQYGNESFVIPNPVVPSDDGLSLQPYSGPPLTVGNELNKLASNISFGRDTAGIHYRSDGIEGMKLGEAVAISVLTDFNATYNENFEGFSLTKFDGSVITLDENPLRHRSHFY